MMKNMDLRKRDTSHESISEAIFDLRFGRPKEEPTDIHYQMRDARCVAAALQRYQYLNPAAPTTVAKMQAAAEAIALGGLGSPYNGLSGTTEGIATIIAALEGLARAPRRERASLLMPSVSGTSPITYPLGALDKLATHADLEVVIVRQQFEALGGKVLEPGALGVAAIETFLQQED